MTIVKILFVLLKWTALCAVLVAVGIAAYVYFAPTFGGKPDAASLARIQASPNFNGEVFVNQEPTTIETIGSNRPSLMTWLTSVLNPPAGKHPSAPLPTLTLDQSAVVNNSFTWFGHSTVLFKTADLTIITDPVFYRASPLFFGGKAFEMTNPPKTADLPFMDIVLLSHDHYDHLDHQAIQEIDHKVGHYYVPLGVKGHLQRWGVADDKITELDWHDSVSLPLGNAEGELTLTLAPARHFSGRNLNNRNSTLWGSWVVKSPQLSLYFNGDSGYGKHFTTIAEQYGPFDLTFIENGAYDPAWASIHMTPEQAAQASLDLQTRIVVPIHWAKFDLAYHTWTDPIERFSTATDGKPLQTATPKIGQTFTLDNLPQEKWWK
ncbi:MBL fold metallo-hydrolase [Testudinibacter aquarius]|uniref:L-ascorbate metabolism protein UlaG (Beta-lactamase superfamily) n=1 Tax=Testudinibacter aquarius TaxID=1524974 RepID=A0A4R3Y2Y5_9PAST|nr:MBL fold metallo-hydrolase [Testudinibacter aquarius]KAE9530351.1 multidrug transporter [Testudinibacter aquarius]TCV85947.1 L-ascorbate metabolism protein UlaG (beta-lactamase superfamily) [Testudinibacter aquarius]TNG93651.1 multidrug transporter [Testudinibacter aquarius]